MALGTFLVDSIRFAQGAADLIEEHPLLVYYGALPYAPADSILYKTFAHEGNLIRVDGRNRHWSPILQVLSGHGAHVTSVAVCRDGSRLASSSHYDNAIRIWDTVSGAETMAPLLRKGSRPLSVAISPDGQSVLAGYDDTTVHVWDLITGSIVLSKHIPIAPPCCRVLTVALSPGGSRFLGAGDLYWAEDYDGNRASDAAWIVAVWDSCSDEQIILRGHLAGIQSAVFTHDGTRVLSGSSDGTVIMWDLVTGTILAKLPFTPTPLGDTEFLPLSATVACVAVSPHDRHALVSDDRGRVRLWDLPARTLITSPIDNIDDVSFLKPIPARNPNAQAPVLFSPDGTTFLTARRQVILVWRTEDTKVLAEYHGHSNEVTSVCYSQETARIISGSSDGTVRIWDATSSSVDELQHTAHSPEREYYMHLIQISTDGRYIIFVPDLTSVSVRGIYDDLRVSYTGHRQYQENTTFPIVSIACSPDDALIASASSDNVICIWKTLTGVDHLPPFHHPDTRSDRLYQDEQFFLAVAFTADSTRLISGSTETVIIWDLGTGSQLFTYLREPETLLSTVFSPSGLSVIRRVGLDIRETNWELWDDTWARSCLFNTYVNVPPPRPNPLTIEPSGWIVRQSTGFVLSKLPSWLSVKKWASSESVLAFTTHQAELFVMHFPSVDLEGT